MRAPISLEQIKIESPCEMPWEQMQGDDQQRFCEKCNLQVTNLSAMTSDAAEKLVGERIDRICVAYVPTAQGTPITLDYEKRKRRFTWKLALFLGIFGAGATAWAQAVLFRTKPVPIVPPTLRGKVMVPGGIGPPMPKRTVIGGQPPTATTPEASQETCTR